METFRSPSPDEAKMLALQFMGQHLGEIKELDRNIISKTNTLQGNVLNVNNVLNSIPAPHALPQRPQQAPAVNHQIQPRTINTPVIQETSSIVDVLNKINSNLEVLIKKLDK